MPTRLVKWCPWMGVVASCDTNRVVRYHLWPDTILYTAFDKTFFLDLFGDCLLVPNDGNVPERLKAQGQSRLQLLLVCRRGLLNTCPDGLLKGSTISVVLRVQILFFDKSPQTFDQIQVW